MEVRPEESALVGVSGTYNCADTCYVLLIHSGENIWDQSVCMENNALFRTVSLGITFYTQCWQIGGAGWFVFPSVCNFKHLQRFPISLALKVHCYMTPIEFFFVSQIRIVPCGADQVCGWYTPSSVYFTPHPLVSVKLSSPGLDLVMLVQVASNPQRSPCLCLLSADIKGESLHASVPSS